MSKQYIEKLVTRLETSKKLKELGVVQLSCFRWLYDNEQECYFLTDHSPHYFDCEITENYAAFTATEILTMRGYTRDIEIAQIYVSVDIEADALIGSVKNDCLDISEININLQRFWEEK